MASAGSVGAQGFNAAANIKQQLNTVKSGENKEAEVEQQPQVPEEKVTLAARFQTTTEALRIQEAGDGQIRSTMTIALVPEEKQAELEKSYGVVFPQIEEVRSNQGLSADGRLELVPVDGTGNAETTHILQTLEVNKSLLQKNAEGKAPIDGMIAQLLPEGASVIPKGYIGVQEGSVTAPKGYEFQMGTSKEGAATHAKRLRLNRFSDAVGNFSQTSLAGIMNFPYVSAAAPFLAVVTAGGALNRNYEDLKSSQDLKGYVEGREKLSKTDMVTLQAPGGVEFAVSAKNEKERLDQKIRQSKSKLLSTGLTLAAGSTSVLGYAAAGGMFGTGSVAAALTGAVAATPFLAGAAMIVGSGGMVVNSLSKLKELSKEKAELLALQEKGQTHVLETIERVNPQAGRHVAIGEENVPISERLKTIEKDQRKHRLLATAMSGGMASIVGTVGLGIGAMTLAPLAMAPAGVLAGAQSISRLKELSKEKKELGELQQTGATMTPRQVERQDGSWGEEKVPISTLLQDIEKKQKTHKLILTAVGSTGAMFGVTLGLGASFLAAAPILLIPAAIGALLFPDKVKAFAEKVGDFFTGRFGDEAKSRKECKANTEALATTARENLINDLEPLATSDPSLFYVPSKHEIKEAKQNGTQAPYGYFTSINGLIDAYAGANSRVERYQVMQQIEAALAQAPDNAKPYMDKVKAHIKTMHDSSEIDWVARDVALEMKKDTTEQVLGDDRVKARIQELGFDSSNEEGLRAQYEGSLKLENDPGRVRELLDKSQKGDQEAAKELAKTEVFGAARLFYQSQEELGSDMLAKLVDALKRPQDEENLELVIKEVNHKLGKPMVPSTSDQGDKWWLDESTQHLQAQSGLNEPLRLGDFAAITNAVNVLEKKIDLSAPLNPPAPLEGAESRMAAAFRELKSVDAKSAVELNDAFTALNTPETYQGLSQEQAIQKKMELGLQLTKAKGALAEKAPEMVALWDKARVDVEEQFFQQSVDQDFAKSVLASTQVTEAAQRLNIAPEAVKALYMGFMRAQLMGDNAAFQRQMVDASGKQEDPAKLELLQVIDGAMVAEATRRSGGGNDTTAPAASLGSPETDPNVVQFLESNPAVSQVLASDQLQALAAQLQSTPEEVRQAYLTLVQAEFSPVLRAEFEGKLQGNDMAAVKTAAMGQEVVKLLQSALRPSADAVAQQVEAGMNGPVVKAVLDHPAIKEFASSNKLDATALMRTLLAADLAGDRSSLDALAQKAQKGDQAAQVELQMVQYLAQLTLQIGQQATAQQSAAA